MIIAVDFDGTLQINGTANIGLIQRLQQAQRRGDIVILWTCREGNRLTEALLFLQKHHFRPNYVNCNCPDAIARLKGDPRKIFADVYIDDKSAK